MTPTIQTPSAASFPLSNGSISTEGRPGPPNNLENAILDSLHTSTTESILAWPHFDSFPSVRDNYVSIFQLEQSRPSLRLRSSTLYPYLPPAELSEILGAFQHGVNFWYPTLSLSQLDDVQTLMAAGLSESADSIASCRAKLVMALGCASQVVSGLIDPGEGPISREERSYRASRRAMADVYFDGALKTMHLVHMEMSCTAVQCLFFTA